MIINPIEFSVLRIFSFSYYILYYIIQNHTLLLHALNLTYTPPKLYESRMHINQTPQPLQSKAYPPALQP